MIKIIIKIQFNRNRLDGLFLLLGKNEACRKVALVLLSILLPDFTSIDSTRLLLFKFKMFSVTTNSSIIVLFFENMVLLGVKWFVMLLVIDGKSSLLLVDVLELKKKVFGYYKFIEEIQSILGKNVKKVQFIDKKIYIVCLKGQNQHLKKKSGQNSPKAKESVCLGSEEIFFKKTRSDEPLRYYRALFIGNWHCTIFPFLAKYEISWNQNSKF